MMASKKKKTKKKTAPKPKAPPRKHVRFDIGNLEIQKTEVDYDLVFRGPGASKYRRITDQVSDLSPGEMLQVPIPEGADAGKFRLAIASAVKRYVHADDRRGRVRCCLLHARDANAGGLPTAVGVMCCE